MKKGLYITQDLVSHGISEVMTVNTDNEVRRFMAICASRTPFEQQYMVKDAQIYHIGNLYVDDETGAIAIEPLPMRLVCRGSDFPMMDKKEDTQFEEDSAFLL